MRIWSIKSKWENETVDLVKARTKALAWKAYRSYYYHESRDPCWVSKIESTPDAAGFVITAVRWVPRWGIATIDVA